MIDSPDPFERLEALNAQFDIWIDDEDYDNVHNATELVAELTELVASCFTDETCSNKSDTKVTWQRLLSWDFSKAPVASVSGEEIDPTAHSSGHAWSILFFAKLLRAHILQRGTDCYLRRLDDVASCLESQLPRVESKDPATAKLAVLCLLEMSALSIGYEILGFAERARRVLRDHSEPTKEGELFQWFYDLWARYNIGLAYFHDGCYQKAVSEFDWIIRNIRQPEEKIGDKSSRADKQGFCNARFGKLLLYFPGVLYRADVQLKLQLAYHALKTLEELFLDEAEESGFYKGVKAKLIQVEAHQQMDRLDCSRELLGQVGNDLELPISLTSTESCEIPHIAIDAGLQNVKVRFLGILVDHYLAVLDGQRLENGKAETWPRIDYLKELNRGFIHSYYRSVRLNAPDRQGYFEQLAKYFSWLAKARRKAEEHGDDRVVDTKAIGAVALELYRQHTNQLLGNHLFLALFDRVQQGGEPAEHDPALCVICTDNSIDLKRLKPDHYSDFTDGILAFFESFNDARQLDSDKEDLIKKLISLERGSRENLRIRDLELRYKSREIVDKLNEEYSKCVRCFPGCPPTSEPYGQEQFTDLEACMRLTNGGSSLNVYDYEKLMGDWFGRFFDPLGERSIHERIGSSLHFLGLQRWNSTSPALGRSIGGGYLLYRTDENGVVNLGIAIDPGFDFVRNLFRMGFSLGDIDIVLLSHAHADHVRDVESILLLLVELAKRDKRRKRLHVILTLGIYRRLEYIIEDPGLRYYIEPYVIDIDKEIDTGYFEGLSKEDSKVKFAFTLADNPLMDYRPVLPDDRVPDPDVTIWPTRAYHDDLSGYSDSFGFRIHFSGSEQEPFVFGYTGDTKWVYPAIEDPSCGDRTIEEVAKQYTKCDTILVHLGSLIDQDKRDGKYHFAHYGPGGDPKSSCDSLIRSKNHPYLPGVLRLLSTLSRSSRKNRPLILLSEFGEELRGGIRSDLVSRLSNLYKQRFDFLPVDVGVDVLLRLPSKHPNAQERPTVLCVLCEGFVRPEKARFIGYGKDEGLFCVCDTCSKGTARNVLRDRLRRLYEEGRELRTNFGAKSGAGSG